MLATLPINSAFADHGLYDIQLDLPGVVASPSAFGPSGPSFQPEMTDWIGGWATLEPVPRFPLLSKPRTDVVRWDLCSHEDAASTTRFRRAMQCLALDTMGPRSTQTRRYSRMKPFVAWWEDDFGLWAVREAVKTKYVPLEQCWARALSDLDVDESTNPREDMPIQGERRLNHQYPGEQRKIMAKYAETCDLLLQVISCLQALHDCRLALLACRPKAFAMDPSSGLAELVRYSEVAVLPGFSLANIDSTLTPIFNRDPLDASSLQLSEDFIRNNLRHLAPEIIGSRRPSQNSDVYSFGVMAYELLTGITINGGPDSPDKTDVDLLADFHRHVTMPIVPPLVMFQRDLDLGAFRAAVPPKQYSDLIMRCLERDSEDRYGSLEALSYDLRKLAEVLRTGGDLGKMVIGQADNMSKFRLPSRSVNCEHELEQLDQIFQKISQSTGPQSSHNDSRSTLPVPAVTLWGLSGAGKTRLVSHWARQWEVAGDGKQCLVAYSKLDELIRRPLSSFVQIFESLLDRVLTDPAEDPKRWNHCIRDVLGSQLPFFSSLLSKESRRLLNLGDDTRDAQDKDWERLPAFKMWGKRLLQLFATRQRPLIVIVDDIQWLPPEEIGSWRSLLDGVNPLDHALVVSLFRVEVTQAPPSSSLLSASSPLIHVPRFDEQGVLAFVNECLHSRIENGLALANFLYAETGGSPLYLSTVLANLVKEQVVIFDFAILSWRFDLLALQSHLSDAGVDVYIERLLLGLPENVKRFLTMLAWLPATGFSFDGVAQLVGASRSDIEAHLHVSHVIGTLIVLQGRVIRFTHDRLRHAAYMLIPADKQGETHHQISKFLRGIEKSEDFTFDAAEHAIAARRLNIKNSDEDFVDLLLMASRRAGSAASFHSSRRFLIEIDKVINATGGSTTWAQQQRPLYIRFLVQFAETYSILKQHDEVLEKLYDMVPLCISPSERIRTATWTMRALIAAGRHTEAMNLVWNTLCQEGYDPDKPENIAIWTPSTVEELEAVQFLDEPVDEDDERVLIMSLLCYAGPTIFVARPNDRAAAFALGFSLAAKVGKVHDTVAYLSATCALTRSGLDIRRALCRLSRQICTLRPNSLIVSASLVVIGAQSHCFRPLHEVAEDMNPAFEATISSCNYELASYVLVLDFAARAFSTFQQDWDVVAKRYEILRPYLPPAMRMLIHAPLQYAENRKAYTPGMKVSLLEGQFITSEDLEQVSALKMHLAFWHTFALREAIMYDAALEEQLALVHEGSKFATAQEGTVVGVEWAFLCAIVFIRNQQDGDKLREAENQLAEYHGSPDYAARIDVLDTLKLLMSGGYDNLAKVEQGIERLDEGNQFALSGLLSNIVGAAVHQRTNCKMLCSGYLRNSFEAHKKSNSFGVCQWLKLKYPDVLPKAPVADFLPSQLLGLNLQPPVLPKLRRASLSRTTETTTSHTPSVTPDEKASGPNDSLDTLTLMRSSVILASEQDPPVLLCTLLRILCQFTRSDYAAIGLSDEDDQTTIRLRAAGPYSRIIPYDLSSNDETFHDTCPAVYMLHVARTGKAITDVSSLKRLRSDLFYGDRRPRSVICLPIANQGRQAGVVLLSSMSAVSSQAQSAGAREIIDCLATFATIVMTNYTFTRRLKLEVDQRTKELTSALAAKSQFLSQCSHELRSPLSAVLGLATVLQASPGLSEVQREHLRTISNSGEDLLGLINNLLDHSRLESGSVTLERIPFTLREVTEGVLDTIAVIAQKKDLEVCLVNSFMTDPPGLLGDPFRVRQVITNLCVNAVKFTSEGRVTVRWRWEKVGDGIKVYLDVEDTGIGIPTQKMDKLFRSFSQIDESITRSFGGSGLGLVISRDLARMLGGDCVAESEFGKGSKFTFSFIADRSDEAEPQYETLKMEKSCFVLCDEGPWWTMLDENLQALNCKPVRFTEDPSIALVRDVPHGMNSEHNYDFVMISTRLVDKETLDKMRELQNKAQFIFLVRSIDLAKDMRDFEITRDTIVARPVKFSSLYNVICNKVDMNQGPESKKGSIKGKKKGINKELYMVSALPNQAYNQTHPLDILLVDDNPVNVNVGRRILELFGYDRVTSAMDGQQAIDAAEKKAYDLILLDLQMPVLDGFSAQKRITASPLTGNPCIVALTANADKTTQEACRDAGFYNYLSKPLDIPKLETILIDVYEHRNKNHIVHH
ncbi:hypothetical protein BCR39DRAFT_519071 [Naematelia encephala]|uniref:Histidine kinase n=1 Tax=Naematelia encephala TaxID=71784 RepID=A0A1Y2BG25_9TREE|nr:hypothetical protein BCR39DRAFT_519071 [Naematelia encephala]